MDILLLLFNPYWIKKSHSDYNMAVKLSLQHLLSHSDYIIGFELIPYLQIITSGNLLKYQSFFGVMV